VFGDEFDVELLAGARWVPVADVAGLSTPTDLLELVVATARWAKTQQ